MIIYKTTNLVNGKIYVGKDKHNNPNYLGSGKRFNDAVKCYGKENFKKEILEYCNSYEHMSEREIYWIEKLDSLHVNGKGYNLTKGGEGGDVFTYHDNKKEYRRKLSKASRRNWADEEYAQKVRDGVNRANNETDVIERRKITAAITNAKPEIIEKRKRIMKEVCNTPEQRAIRSKNSSGTNNSNYKGPYYVLRGTILEEFTFKKDMTAKDWKSRIQ